MRGDDERDNQRTPPTRYNRASDARRMDDRDDTMTKHDGNKTTMVMTLTVRTMTIIMTMTMGRLHIGPCTHI